MRDQLLGGTGLRVSELFLGAMTFGEQGGASEEIVGELLHGRRAGPGGGARGDVAAAVRS